MSELLGGGSVVLLAVTSKGLVYQVSGGSLSGSNFDLILNGRSAVVDLLDRCGVADAPLSGKLN